LSRVKAGDAQALEEMYDAYAPRIYRFLYSRLGDAHLAEDLTGDVFLRALAALRSGRFADEELSAWLFQIARNRLIDHFRRSPPGAIEVWDETLGDELEEVGSAMEDALVAEWLRHALSYLSPEQKQVIHLRFGEGLSAIEVADVLGSNAAAVRALQYRALTALRRLFFDGTPNPSGWSA
jgi:RNA polymerase sigma-70 factor (ECF subfamily)